MSVRTHRYKLFGPELLNTLLITLLHPAVPQGNTKGWGILSSLIIVMVVK